jgi:hypothetical protein
LLLSLTIPGSKQLIFFAVGYILPCFWPWFGHNPHGQRFWFLALKNITQKEIFVHSLGLFGSSKLTSKVVVIALAAGLLGAGVVLVAPADPASATACGSGSTSATYSPGPDGPGDGLSTSTAFRISTAADLIRLSHITSTNTTDLSRHFIQTANIDLGGCEWTPIGLTDSSKFTGSYNGGGFTIQGLKITTPRNYVGMFGTINGARIERLVLKGEINVSHTLPSTDDVYYVGSLVGSAVGTSTVISQVRSEVSMVTNVRSTGGIVAEMTGTLQYSSFQASMQVERGPGNGWGYSGGLTATLAGASTSINNSYSRASFSGASTYKSGLNSISTPPIRQSYSASTGVNAALAGQGSNSAVNAFWDATLAPGVNPRWSDSSAITNASGVSTSSMTSIRTFSTGASAWDIVEGWEPFSSTSSPAKIWGICSAVNDGYPFLLWEYTIDPCTVAPPPSNSSSGSSGGFSAPPQTTVTSSGTTLTVNLNKTRELLLSGSNLNLVTQASVGGKNATINFVASDSGNLVISTLPLLPSGKYTLTLLTPTGLVPGEVEVGIIARITKLRAIEASGKLSTQVRSEVRKQNLTYDSAGTLSCWGVTTSSSGSALALAKQKAEKVCAYAKRQNPELDVVASSRTGTGKPARNQVVKIRYLK